MKKKIVYALVAALTISMLSGCGSQEKKGHKVNVSLTEVVENAVGAVEDVETFGINVSADIKASGESEGQKVSLSGSAKGESAFSLSEKPAFSMEGKLNYSMNVAGQSMKGDYKASAYGETEDDEMTVYVNFLDEWMKDTVDVSGFVDSFDEMKSSIADIQEAISEIDESDLEEVKEFFDLEKNTKYVGSTECYVLSATLDTNDIDSLDKFGISADELEGVEDVMVKYSMYLNKKTFFPTKFEINLKGKFDQDGMVVNIEKCNAVVTFKVNSVKVKGVPSDAVNKAEETDLGLDDMVGSSYDYAEEDDYDYEDNYDYDEEYDASNNNYSFSESGNYSKDTVKVPKTAKFNGVEFKYGVKAKELNKFKFEIDEEYTDEELGVDESGSVCMDIPDTNDYIWVNIVNNDSQEKSWEECEIVSLSYEPNSYPDDVLEFSLDNGLKIGGSVDDVKKLYGDAEPVYVYNGEYSSTVSYEDDDYNEIEITYDPVSGTITGLDVQFSK